MRISLAKHTLGHLDDDGYCRCGKPCCVGEFSGNCECAACACQQTPIGEATPYMHTPYTGAYSGVNYTIT